MTTKTTTVKVTRHGHTLATVTLTPKEFDGYWAVTLDGQYIGELSRYVEARSIPLGGGSRLAREGVSRTYWDGRDVNGKALGGSYLSLSRLDVLRALVDTVRRRDQMAAAAIVAQREHTYVRVENMPGYAAVESLLTGLVYAAYRMDHDTGIPTFVARVADPAALAPFLAAVDGVNLYEAAAGDRGVARAFVTTNPEIAFEGFSARVGLSGDMYDDVAIAALRKARA